MGFDDNCEQKADSSVNEFEKEYLRSGILDWLMNRCWLMFSVNAPFRNILNAKLPLQACKPPSQLSKFDLETVPYRRL
jgi:hypothetical protein